MPVSITVQALQCTQSIKVKNIPEKEKEKVIEQEVEQSLIQDLSRCQEDELCSKTVGAPNG